MSATLHYNLKRVMPELSQYRRLNVLIAFILYANTNNRAYPSMETVAGLACNGNKSQAIKAKDWLIEHGALEIVPHDKRYGEDEESLPPRQFVYKLTGILNLDGEEIPYLYFGQSSKIKPLNSKRLNSKGLESEPKVLPSLESITIKESSTEEPSLSIPELKTTPSPEWRNEDWYKGDGYDYQRIEPKSRLLTGRDALTFPIRMNALFWAWRRGLEDNGVQSLKDTDSIWKTNLRDIGKLAQSDVTPYMVYQYVCEQYKQDWWKQGKTLPFTNILDNILNWQPTLTTATNGATQPTHSPDYHKPVTPLAVSKPLTADDIKRIKQEALGND